MSRDEREETGARAVLNFGHTIGHAIEAVAGYHGGFLHGEAVAVGMVAESRLAHRLGWIGSDLVDRLARLLERLGLPTEAPGLDVDDLFLAIHRDKKNQRGRVRFVLPRALGSVELTDLPPGARHPRGAVAPRSACPGRAIPRDAGLEGLTLVEHALYPVHER